MELLDPNKEKKVKILIYTISILVPIVVVILFGVRIEGVNLSFLPPLYSMINGITAFLLVLALIAIKNKMTKVHRLIIRVCLFLSLLFLASYVAYHMTSSPTQYKGDLKELYYFILISHISLSIVIIPLVLLTYLFAWKGDFERHKKWTRFTWPIWFYVAITGVIVYLMISPYYLN